MTLTLDKQLELHRMMMLIRLFEEALEEMFSRGLLHGTMHLSIGQEASAAGACLALDKEDLITSTHRGHGHCLGNCLLYTSPSPRDVEESRMPSSA